jgi:uncharacterized protein DUF3558
VHRSLIAVAVMLSLAGCTDAKGGTATPATTTDGGSESSSQAPNPSGSPSASNGAPVIDNPLDAIRYLSQPCSVLSAAQLQQFNITSPGVPHVDDPAARATGPYCGWRTGDAIPRGFTVGFLVANKRGLADTIRGGRDAFPGYFEPTEVSGYPGVFNDLVDGRSRGTCNLTVGISDTLAFQTTEQAGRDQGVKSCDDVKQMAAAVIQTLKEG